jgi:hypothetical protein
MANSDIVFLKGKLKWVKHIRPDTAFEPHKWSITIYPDAESLEKIKALKKEGLQNHLKLDDDGQYMAFSRKTEREVRGRKEGVAPPRVINSTGQPIEVSIGNGSDGIVELETYKHKTQQPGVFKRAARWKGLRVDNLIEFKPETDYPDGGESIKELRQEPEQLF